MSGSNVVITGAALVSPLGLTRGATFAAVLEGRCGIGSFTAMESELPAGRDGGEAPTLDDDFEPALPREARHLRKVIIDALADAGMPGKPVYPAERCGLMIGTTLHGMRAAGQFLRTDDFTHLGRFLAAHVARSAAGELGLGGLSATTCSACSSSLGSIALGMTLLESGDFDLVIAGGYDPVSEYVYAGFNSLRLVAEGPLRPFARGRQGMKLSEAYAIVVLERADDARRRGAHGLARIAGFGESADAHHLTQPHPQGEGASRAMLAAIESAGLMPQDIGLLVAHATGTPDNDAAEFAAMSSVFRERLGRIPCVAFKSHLGHTLGGAGAVELILGAMAMQKQIVPPCANVSGDEVEFPGLDLVTGVARPAGICATLSTSLGFGGANTCVVLVPAEAESGSAASAEASGKEGATRISDGAVGAPTGPLWHLAKGYARGGRATIGERDAVITGIGVVLPAAIGESQFVSLLDAPESALASSAGTIADEQIAHLVNARRVRRMSDYVKYMLAATTLALEDAGVSDVPAFAESCSAILGTTHGSCGYCEQYYRQIVREGVLAANPMLFAEGVPNAASAHVSLMLGLRGGCQTIIGSRTAGLDALGLAMRRIRTGRCDRIIVGTAEEWSALTSQAYGNCGMARETMGSLPFEDASGFVTSAGAVVLLVESRKAAMARGARIRAVVLDVATRVGKAADAANTVSCAVSAIGRPRQLISSADATWVDRAEVAGIGRASCEGATVTSMYGHIAETFSVTPLAGIAAALWGKRLPRLRGTGQITGANVSDGTLAAADFGVLCTDFSGVVTAARLQRVGGDA